MRWSTDRAISDADCAKGAVRVQDRLLTVDEVARELRVSTGSIRAWLRQGHMRGFKIGKFWRVREQDLRDYVERAASQCLTSGSNSGC